MPQNRISILLFLRVTFCLFFLASLTAHAQKSSATKINPGSISNDQLLKYYQQAKATGMSDMQIEKAAMEKGYTIDDITRLRQRLDESISTAGSSTTSQRDTIGTRRTSPNESIDSSRLATLKSTAQASQLFGASFFANGAMTFEPNLRLATPQNYILGPDDVLVVDIYGNAVDNFTLKVSPEGTVKMLNLSPVYVNGLTIEQATERIISKLRTAYSSLNRSGTYASITLGAVRSIKVMVTGEVSQPGSYTVSSLATAFNVLYQSGGPTANGTYRKIQIRRNNSIIRTIDLYDFLLDADLKDNISLRDQDVILIPPYENRIELTGEVKRPGLFETKTGENLNNLLRFAGGFSTNAYSASINLRRSTGKEYKVSSVSKADFANLQPENGDKFTVGRIINRFENRVLIEGAVLRPGEYALEPNSSTVGELIKKAEGLRQDAFLGRAIILRKKDNLEPELIAFNLGDLVNERIPDIPLKKEDQLQINSLSDLKGEFKVTISGSVNNSGTYDYAESMTVEDLILLSGGLSEGAIHYRIEIARRVKDDTTGLIPFQNVRIYSYSIDKSIAFQNNNPPFPLQPFDMVFIRSSPRYETQKTAFINGEIMFPGHYPIISNFERISELIGKAGGMKPNSYIQGAQLIRDGKPVGLDLKSILKNPNQASNIQIQLGDTLIIPKKLETVSIAGEVLNPSIVNFEKRDSFRDYIAKAGGFTERAKKPKGYIIHPNGIVDRTRKFLFFNAYPKVEPGSSIVVPAKIKQEATRMSPGERIAVFSMLTTLIITAVNLTLQYR